MERRMVQNERGRKGQRRINKKSTKRTRRMKDGR
jgi:hypothetical protein